MWLLWFARSALGPREPSTDGRAIGAESTCHTHIGVNRREREGRKGNLLRFLRFAWACGRLGKLHDRPRMPFPLALGLGSSSGELTAGALFSSGR
jgi:hypothetical protein